MNDYTEPDRSARFARGDVVQLRSGGRPMTVYGVYKTACPQVLTCVFQREDGEIAELPVDQALLALVTRPGRDPHDPINPPRSMSLQEVQNRLIEIQKVHTQGALPLQADGTPAPNDPQQRAIAVVLQLGRLIYDLEGAIHADSHSPGLSST